MGISFSNNRSGNIVIFSNVRRSGAEVLYSTETFAKKPIEHVVSNTSGGSITVTGGSAEHKVEVYVSSNNGSTLSKEQIQARLKEHYELEVEVEDGTLAASARRKSAHFSCRKLNISFSIYVAGKVSTHLRTVGGDITLRNLTGNLHDFKTSGGDLTIARLNGQIRGMTSGGDIHISNSKDDIDMSTSGGNVNASDCSGRLHLRTSGGDVELDHLEGTIDARTSGGDVRADTINGSLAVSTSGGDLNLKRISGSLDARASGGDISVSMTEINGDTKVSSSCGDVSLRLPSDGNYYLNAFGMDVTTSGLDRNFGMISETAARGKVNGGGASVTVKGDDVHIKLV
ncbi:putative adhesin domain-containing protein [Ditylenchus destructor]|uniref:Adhesin domain-containing protein n=1 Tax=Ditylenchus destructor TaxID=166010 RepID=A0AAD4MRV7_9BILA|nr:putative adhesin domain-containing protein [Ditylenchus destructor]